MAVGDDGAGAALQEACRVVVDPLMSDGQRRRGPAWLGVPGGVAEIAEEDDRVGSEAEGRDGRLAVVLVHVVGQVVRVVQPEPVLRRVVRVIGVGARPAVAVTVVEDDVRAGCGGLHLRPGRVRAVDLGHPRRVLDRLRVGLVGVRPVGAGRALGRSDDDHHLGIADRDGRGRGARGADGRQEGEERSGGETSQ